MNISANYVLAQPRFQVSGSISSQASESEASVQCEPQDLLRGEVK